MIDEVVRLDILHVEIQTDDNVVVETNIVDTILRYDWRDTLEIVFEIQV